MIMREFINKYSIPGVCLGILEQVLVVLSTLCMIRLGQCIDRPRELLFWAVIFILLLFLVFLPRYGYQYFLIRSKYDTFQSMIRKFEAAYRHKPYIALEKIFSNERKTFFYNETWNVVNESYDFMLDFGLTFLNICFSIAVIGIAVERKFIISYIAAFAIALLFYIGSRGKTEELSLAAQNAHVNMNTFLFYGWETILADNPYNREIWEKDIEDSVQKAVHSGVRKLKRVSGISALAMIVSSLPIFLLLIQTLYHSQSAGTTAVLIVTLPRQINTIQYLNLLISYIMSWNGVHAKIKGLEKASRIPEDLVFKPEYIDFSKICLKKDHASYTFSNFDELAGWDEWGKAGRITVRGDNGSGKSTLCVGLKLRFGESAYYFSPSWNVYFSDSARRTLSLGETALNNMREILSRVNADILILDEWDANLDAANIEKMNECFDKLAGKACIVEVRHRGE